MIHGPKGRPFVGNLYDYDRDRIGFLTDCQRQYGDLFRYSPEVVVIADPALAHTVLVDSGREFIARSSSAVESRRRRQRMWHAVNPKTVAGHAARLSRDVADRLGSLAGGVFPLVESMQAVCAHAAATFFLREEHIAEAAIGASSALLNLVEQDLPAPGQRPGRRLRRGLAAEEHAVALLTQALATRRDPPTGPPRDALESLLTSPTHRPPSLPDSAHLIEAAVFGAQGNTGATLSWALRELRRQPDLLTSIRSEVRAHPDALHTGDIDQLPRTRALVHEILRVYPPAWLLSRIVAQQTHIRGETLTCGERVAICLPLIHRDARWWPHPDSVLPDRWRNALPPAPAHSYLPFGGGPHRCPGIHLGTSIVTIALAHIVADYDIALVNPAHRIPTPDALFTPAGLRATLTPHPKDRHEP